jgi:hypothetical protein
MVEPPILHGLGDVPLVNLSNFIEIGQRAGDVANTIPCAGTQAKLATGSTRAASTSAPIEATEDGMST